MRIAIPTNDGTTISEHFGRSAAFAVFEIENGQVKARELRTNAGQHLHEEGGCGHRAEGHGPHSHAGILSALAGCETVICGGMGPRAAEALKSAGVTPVITAVPGSIEGAIAAYVKGELAAGPDEYCRCRH